MYLFPPQARAPIARLETCFRISFPLQSFFSSFSCSLSFFFFLLSCCCIAIDVAGRQRLTTGGNKQTDKPLSDAFPPLIDAGAVVLPTKSIESSFFPRMAQLPPEAEGVAVAILIYSFLCLFCNVLMIWLLWTSQQTFSRTLKFISTCFLGRLVEFGPKFTPFPPVCARRKKR